MDEPKYRLCANCVAWYFNKKDMQCRRRAPTRDLQCHPQWPNTLPTMYCLEWEPADRLEVERRKNLLKPVEKNNSIEDIEIVD